MRLRELLKYNIPELLLDAWAKRQGEYLLPLQEKAIRGGLLESAPGAELPHLLISAPTSSGKSFCGEIAAIAALLRRRKAVMLFPLKSIAEEKYHHFRACYQQLGIKILIVTADHPENDAPFQFGDFDLALAIYEKFNRLLTAQLDILQQLGLIVVDEIQMLGDPERGPELEMALAKVIASGYTPRLVALSAVLDDETALARWLNCRLIKESTRPVDLLQGIAVAGNFHYRSFNTGIEGDEAFPLRSDREGLTASLLDFLRDDPRRKLIFLKSRRDTINAAFKLAASVNWGEAKATLAQVEEEEPSFLIRALRQTLSRGVAFHNADLTPAQRKAVEQGYLSGEIRVIFSTTTLAMGVNLPAEMVLLETMKYRSGDFGGRPLLVPITASEFRNITGRAGRFGLAEGEKPGRAVILADSEFEQEVLWSNYIETGAREALRSQLSAYPVEDILLDLIASGLGVDPLSRQRALGALFGAQQDAVIDDVSCERACQRLLKEKLLDTSGAVTPLGRAVAEKGLTFSGYCHYRQLLARRVPQTLVGWLALALSAPDFDIAAAGLSRFEYRQRHYEAVLHQQFHDYIADMVILPGENAGGIDYHTAAVLKATFLLSEWAREIPVERLEPRYQLHHGQIIHLAETASWLLITLAAILHAENADSPLPQRLEEDAFSVQFGILPDRRDLHYRFGDILTRADFSLLRQNNIARPDDLRQLPPEQMVPLIKPESKRNKIIERLQSLIEEDNMGRITPLNSVAGYHPAAAFSAAGFRPALLELDGSYQGERYLVRIDGFPIRLTGKSFKYLVKLAYARLSPAAGGEGWAYKDDIEVGFNQARYLYRLKQEINAGAGGKHPWQIFENNRLGYYRLDIEPAKISLNLENLKSHPDYELRHIAEELTLKKVS